MGGHIVLVNWFEILLVLEYRGKVNDVPPMALQTNAQNEWD